MLAFDRFVVALGLKPVIPSRRAIAWVDASGADAPLPMRNAVLIAPKLHLGLVRRLAQGKGVGLVGPSADGELVAACRRAGLGLALWPQGSNPQTLTERARGLVLEACFPHALSLGPLIEILSALAESEPRLIEALYRWTRLPTALVASWGQPIAFAGAIPKSHPTNPGRGPGHLAFSAGGALLVAYGEGEALERSAGFYALAAQVLAARSLLTQAQRAEEEGLKATLLDDLLVGEADERRATAYGFAPGVPYVVALAQPPPITGQHRLAEERRRAVLLKLRQQAAGYLDRLGTAYLMSVRAGKAVVLWQTYATEREVEGLSQALGGEVQLGYSATHEALKEVPTAYREALIALKTAKNQNPAGFARLDPVAWVLLQQSREDLKAIVDRFLPLEAKLLRTVEAYLTYRDVEAAARALHVHPNTLRYRLSRIEERLGGSLKAPETLAQVHLALRAKALLED